MGWMLNSTTLAARWTTKELLSTGGSPGAAASSTCVMIDDVRVTPIAPVNVTVPATPATDSNGPPKRVAVETLSVTTNKLSGPVATRSLSASTISTMGRVENAVPDTPPCTGCCTKVRWVARENISNVTLVPVAGPTEAISECIPFALMEKPGPAVATPAEATAVEGPVTTPLPVLTANVTVAVESGPTVMRFPTASRISTLGTVLSSSLKRTRLDGSNKKLIDAAVANAVVHVVSDDSEPNPMLFWAERTMLKSVAGTSPVAVYVVSGALTSATRESDVVRILYEETAGPSTVPGSDQENWMLNSSTAAHVITGTLGGLAPVVQITPTSAESPAPLRAITLTS